MNSVSNKGITEYQRIYQKVYGIELTFEEAMKQANNLIDLLWLLLPSSSNNGNAYEELSNRTTKK